MLSIEYNKPIEPIIRSTSPTTPEVHNDDESTSSEEDEDKKKKDEKVPDFFVHIIEKGDTLVGLSLKYGVQVDVLARINFLNKSNFHQISHIKQLKIPTNGKTISPQVLRTPTKQEITNEFARKNKLNADEARYYLEDNNWDIEAATKELEKDEEWEKENAQKFKASEHFEPLPIRREAKDKVHSKKWCK